LRAWVKRRQAAKRQPPQVADREEFKTHLRRIGVTEGALVMAHTSITGLQLTESRRPKQSPQTFVALAAQLVDDLLGLVGPTGTLVMPTIPLYQFQNDATGPREEDGPVRYDPRTEPCGVGLANELFWRRKGVDRSLHPFNSLAACGPLAGELLHDNLNGAKPLPHGVDSGYYRFSQRNGLVISVGVPLARCMTLIHAAEEARDAQWPIEGFFRERQYLVNVDGRDKMCVVRERRPEYGMFCLCLRKLMRDLRGESILHESMVGTVRVDWAHSREVFDYLMARNERVPYPYYWAWVVRKAR
jgi:aminoglycoside 3-N-acetyltransferase